MSLSRHRVGDHTIDTEHYQDETDAGKDAKENQTETRT